VGLSHTAYGYRHTTVPNIHTNFAAATTHRTRQLMLAVLWQMPNSGETENRTPLPSKARTSLSTGYEKTLQRLLPLLSMFMRTKRACLNAGEENKGEVRGENKYAVEQATSSILFVLMRKTRQKETYIQEECHQ
jgi:hypothetical protein